MYRLGFFLVMLFLVVVPKAQGIPPIGQWRDHVPLRQVTGISIDNGTVMAATPFGYYRYTMSTKAVEVKTKSAGLSEARLRWLSKDPSSQKKLLVYENANMDLAQGDQLRNIPDLMLSAVPGDKSINHVLWIGSDVYLSSNLGIIVLNSLRYEIKDTYKPSVNGAGLRVFQTAQHDGQLYAATQEGLKSAPFQPLLLSDYQKWTAEKFNAGDVVHCEEVLSWGQWLVARKQDSLFIKRNGSWSLLHVSTVPLTGMNLSDKIMCVSRSIQGKGSVLLFDAAGNLIETLASPSMSMPSQCLVEGSIRWVGDNINGLLKIDAGTETRIVPDAPYDLAYGRGLYSQGLVWAAAGRLGTNGQPFENPHGFYVLGEPGWKSYNRFTTPGLEAIKDITCVASDPSTAITYAGSYGAGLLVKEGEKLTLLAQNSPIAAALSDPVSFRVTGLALDLNGNLWASNHGAQQNLLAKKKDGSWKKFTIPFVHKDNAVADIHVDRLNRKWIISPQGNGLFCFDDNGTVDQTSDDRWRYFRQGKGDGNLPSNQVLSVAADRNDFIWVGTARGIGIIQCGEDVFNASVCDATLPVVQQGSFAGLLLADESINAIQVDGADRKWVATNNGVWLLSPDGQKNIYRFTADNSPLLSNEVFSLVINDATGEVFFFTANGICSFRSTATQPIETKQDLLVFPNPVPPGYAGTIAIRGVPENAWVRITGLDGRLVFQTRSLGGQAVWNGKNYQGERVSSGAYLVMVSDAQNSYQLAGKLFFLK